MNYKEFTKEVYAYVDDETVTQKQTNDVIESFVEALKEQTSKGENVRINDLGIFKYKERAARKARNPATGKSVDVPAKASVSFKLSKSYKELMNEVEIN